MTKPTLILLHGAIGSKDQLIPVARVLSEEFDIHTLDFSGHGGLPINQEFSFDLFVDDVLNYMNQENISNAHFFGYSMGGYVALYLAYKHPELVTSIFTLGTKFDWHPEGALKETKMLNPAKIEEKIPAFAEVLKKRHAPENWKKVLDYTKAFLIALGDAPVLTNTRLSQISQKSYISVGSEDNMVSQEETKLTAETLLNAHFILFEGFKHPIEQIDIDVLSDSIKSHLLN